MLINLKKIFRFGAQNFARNFWFALLTISILILLLLSVNGLFIINFLTDEAAKQMQSKVDISVYLKSGTSDGEAQNLKAYLSKLSSISSIIYTKPDDVLENFKETHKNDTKILSSLSLLASNPFGGVLTVQTANVNDYKTVLSQLNNKVYEKIIENKDFGEHEKLVSLINRLTSFIKEFIILVSAFFAFIAMVIIFNTIKIAIYTHREEIAIMRLVGAANWFVCAPFVVEAIFYSIIATIVAFAAVVPLLWLIQPKIVAFFDGQGGDLFAYYRSNVFILLGIQFAVVALLSAVSATLAVGRYLKK